MTQKATLGFSLANGHQLTVNWDPVGGFVAFVDGVAVPSTGSVIIPSGTVSAGSAWEPPSNLLRVPATSTISIVPRASLIAPAVGASVIDPNLSKLSMKRLTQTAGPVYSQLQAFDDSGDALVLVEGNVGYSIQSFPLAVKKAIALGAAPRWHKDKVYYFDTVSNPVKLKSVDKDGNVATVWTGDAAHPFYKAAPVEEMISENGWTIAWIHNGSYSSIRLLAVNVETGAEGAHIDLINLWQPLGPGVPDPMYGMMEPNWVAMSPLGTYMAVAWSNDGTKRNSGMELFDAKSGAFVRQIYQGHQHGDQCVLMDGREAYLSVAVNTSDVTLHYYDGTSPKTVRKMPWGSFNHASCRGPQGWVLIDGQPATGGVSVEAELYLMRLEGVNAGEIVRLCHVRSVGDYWTQPKATWSHDGKHVVWNENFGSGAPFCMDVELV